MSDQTPDNTLGYRHVISPCHGPKFSEVTSSSKHQFMSIERQIMLMNAYSLPS